MVVPFYISTNIVTKILFNNSAPHSFLVKTPLNFSRPSVFSSISTWLLPFPVTACIKITSDVNDRIEDTCSPSYCFMYLQHVEQGTQAIFLTSLLKLSPPLLSVENPPWFFYQHLIFFIVVVTTSSTVKIFFLPIVFFSFRMISLGVPKGRLLSKRFGGKCTKLLFQKTVSLWMPSKSVRAPVAFIFLGILPISLFFNFLFWKIYRSKKISKEMNRESCVAFTQLPMLTSWTTTTSFYMSTISEPDLPWWLSGKESACQAGDAGLIPRLGNIPWRRRWQPIPLFLLGNPTDRAAWQATVLGSQKSRTRLSN